ncbi:MAG TPA: mandelate racemase/muconate lactonizing enzyme family protein [Candidatus Bathyarchaeota archaeon]|nr:mandelate racemase/muconate lactonizing enzyme family protein [Candidatus Bathyarchaeota archaeon]
MRITDLRSRVVAVPIKKSTYVSGLNEELFRIAVIVELFTDEGYVGLGEAVPPVDVEATKRIIDSAKRLLVGEEVFNLEPLKKKVYAYYNLSHLHLHAANWALNAVDMALWDLIGKSCSQPLYKVWGGAFRKKIPYYGAIQRSTVENVARQAEDLVKRGFKTLYLKVGLDEKEDLECVKAIREAVGYGDVKVRLDANQAWSPGKAIKMINKLSKYEIEFVDQPVLMYNLDAMARVRRAVDVPIAAHESSWTFYEVLNVIKKEAADIIHIDPRFDAGFTGARISAGIAEAAGLPVVMHSFHELGIAQCAYMHLIASCPNFVYANQTAYDDLLDDVIEGGPLKFKDGCMEVPERSGIGVELDEEKVKEYQKLYEEVRSKLTKKFSKYRLMSYRSFFKSEDCEKGLK